MLSLPSSPTECHFWKEKNTIAHSERLVTRETCDHSDEETFPGQQKYTYKYK